MEPEHAPGQKKQGLSLLYKLTLPLIILPAVAIRLYIVPDSNNIEVLVSTLTALPMFFIASAVIANVSDKKWVQPLAASLVAASFPALILVKDFQEISIGFLWATFFVLFIDRALFRGGFINYLLMSIFFVLTGFTSLESSGFIVAFALCFLFFSFLIYKQRRMQTIVTFFFISFLLGLTIVLFWTLESAFLDRLSNISADPMKIFENPIAIGVKNGEIRILSFMLISAIYAYIIVLLSLVLYLRRKIVVPKREKILWLSLCSLALSLACPFLGEEWATKSYLMAYLPTTILIAFILKYTYAWWKKLLILGFVLSMMLAPLLFLAENESL